MKRGGLFIAFEGLDGAGSTTQAYMLEQYLKQKNKVLLTKEPTQNIIGGIIRAVLRGGATSLRPKHCSFFLRQTGQTILKKKYSLHLRRVL